MQNRKSNVILDKSFAFAIRIVKLYQHLCKVKKEFVLSKQVLRSGTSIGANIREAIHAHGKKEFLFKTELSLKEAYETLYWIELLSATDYINDKGKKSLWKDCDEIVSILVAIVKTTKESL